MSGEEDADYYYDQPPPVDSYNLKATPSAILGMLYILICVIALFKDVIPRVLKWYRVKEYKPRLLMVYCFICITSVVRSVYFFIIAYNYATETEEYNSRLLYILWWIPEFCMFVNIVSIVYFWCEVYAKRRGCNIFSYAQFRSQLFIAELFYITLIFLVQGFFTAGIMFSSPDLQTTWLVLDSVYIGTISFFLGILGFTLGLQIKLLSKDDDDANPDNAFFHLILTVMIFWSIGRLARVIDVFSTIPLWSSWDAVFTQSNYYWIYIVTLYLIMEIIPQSLLLLSTISSRIDFMENPRNLNELDRKRALTILRKRVKDLLVPSEAWDFEGPLLGKGAYSNVYSGVLNGEYVAIKLFTKVLQREIEPLELFCREIETLSTLDHPNILKLIAVHIALEDTIYMFTELADKGNLSDVLESDMEISHEMKLAWAQQIASGMAYLHDNNILHRDLKSANILVFSDNVCKIGDFGVTSMYNEFNGVTGLVGTDYWMAPEMLRGEQYDFKVDVYSYGNILWELLTREKIQNKNQRYDQALDGPMIVIKLMQCCISEVPENRPNFRDIANYLSKKHPEEPYLLSSINFNNS